MGGSNPKEVGISDEFLRTIEDALSPGSSALLVTDDGDVVGQLIAEVRSSEVVVRTEVPTAAQREPDAAGAGGDLESLGFRLAGIVLSPIVYAAKIGSRRREERA